jgi:hypothetical protein
MSRAFYNTQIPRILPAGTNSRQKMDKFEEIGRRIDAEMERLRRYVDEEIAPETERRTATFLRDVSGKLDEFAGKLEARMSRRAPPPAAPPEDPKP